MLHGTTLIRQGNLAELPEIGGLGGNPRPLQIQIIPHLSLLLLFLLFLSLYLSLLLAVMLRVFAGTGR